MNGLVGSRFYCGPVRGPPYHLDQAETKCAEPKSGIDYLAFVDMSGGGSDDAVLGIAHRDGTKAILDVLINQGEATPFNPRAAVVARFAPACRRFRIRTVHGDAYAGETFRHDFRDCALDYVVTGKLRTDLYEDAEVAFNAGQIEMPDCPF